MSLGSWTLSSPVVVTFTPVGVTDKDKVTLNLKSVFDFKSKTYLKGTDIRTGSVVAFDTSQLVGGCFFLRGGEAVVCAGKNTQAIKAVVLEHPENITEVEAVPSAAYITRKEILAFDESATRYKKPLSINPSAVTKITVCLLIGAAFWFFLAEFAGRERTMSPAMIRVQQEKLIKAQLVDPDSARFSDQFHGKREGTWCGWVNARNSLGGYTGNQRFIALSSVGFIESALPSSDFEDMWASACR